MSTTKSTQIPFRQIRAVYDEETITVYQAYSSSIAIAAVKEQKLSASPNFSSSRMTWIKPSWCWMMYRSGYSLKDPRQSHILALKMTHENFKNLLQNAVVTHGQSLMAEDRQKAVRVQWDPERGPALELLPYRSIQIGIGPALSRIWADEWVQSIEDVTAKALGLREAVSKAATFEQMVEGGWMPIERTFEIDEELRGVLKMGEAI